MKKKVFDLGLWVQDMLEICGLVYVKSILNEKDFYGYTSHGKTFEESGLVCYDKDHYKEIDVSEPQVEITLDEIADKFNIHVSRLKIKK